MIKKEKIVVGLNDFIEEDEKIDIPILKISKEVERVQVARLKEMKASAPNNEKVQETLAAMVQAANDNLNLMPRILDCARNHVTLGEMCNALKEPFGVFKNRLYFKI